MPIFSGHVSFARCVVLVLHPTFVYILSLGRESTTADGYIWFLDIVAAGRCTTRSFSILDAPRSACIDDNNIHLLKSPDSKFFKFVVNVDRVVMHLAMHVAISDETIMPFPVRP